MAAADATRIADRKLDRSPNSSAAIAARATG